MDDYKRIYGVSTEGLPGEARANHDQIKAETSIYPNLPVNSDPVNFRLQKSCEVLNKSSKGN